MGIRIVRVGGTWCSKVVRVRGTWVLGYLGTWVARIGGTLAHVVVGVGEVVGGGEGEGGGAPNGADGQKFCQEGLSED